MAAGVEVGCAWVRVPIYLSPNNAGWLAYSMGQPPEERMGATAVEAVEQMVNRLAGEPDSYVTIHEDHIPQHQAQDNPEELAA